MQVKAYKISRRLWLLVSYTYLRNHFAHSKRKRNQAAHWLSTPSNSSEFGNEPFLRHQSRVFPSYTLLHAYQAKAKEKNFRKTVLTRHITDFPNNSNIIASHTLYKVTISDDQAPKFKCQILSHLNEDNSRYSILSDCSMCRLSEFCIIATIASLNIWRLTRVDVKTSFLQTGHV